MKRLVFISLVFIITLGITNVAFAFTFVEEGFPKEPDHNRKWIMLQVNDEKYYFETAKEIDLEYLEFNGHIYFDKDILNNGKSIIIYNYDNNDGKWKSRSVSKQVIEIGSEYKILYTNYNVSVEFIMFQPYLKFIKNCLNISDILAFCIMMFAAVISATFIKRNGWLL